MKRSLAALAMIALAAPAAAAAPGIGTGWSRAPDLSVYAAMKLARELAIEQEVLCAGRNPVAVEDRWRADHAEREAWIAAALADRYGADAVAQAERRRLVGPEPCDAIGRNRWPRQHGELLRLLELRLYPRDHWRLS